MIADTVTPGGFDIILVISTIPLLVGVLLLTATRIARYRAVRGADNHESAKYLASVLAGIGWLAVGIAFILRPLADLFPDQLTQAELLVGPGSRIVATIVVFVLLWHEHAENDVAEPGPPHPKFRRKSDRADQDGFGE